MGEVLSFAHAFLDAGKRSITLDRATPAGRELLVELAASSDAIIETPAAAGDERIDVERIRQRNPGLVLVSISAFGRDGPYAGYRATDLTLLAAGGLSRSAAMPTASRSPSRASRRCWLQASTARSRC